MALSKRGYQWKQRFGRSLLEFGHRNWIVIADAAYPAQSNPGIETIVTSCGHLDVLTHVLRSISKQTHVRPQIYVDSELNAVPDADAPGVRNYRRQLKATFGLNKAAELRDDLSKTCSPSSSQLLSALQVFAAPGRVNLIGEHTDYCDGFVLPAAIDCSTVVAISPRTDSRVVMHSVNFNERVDKTALELLDDGFASLRAGRNVHWSDYPAGVLWALRERGVPIANGFSLTIAGDVPLGAGLSSSASVEVATAFAVLGATSFDMPLSEIAQLCRHAENVFVGANVGIMDQFVSCCGAQDSAVMIDCRTLEYILAPIPSEVRIVICNSMVKHSVVGGEYNTRRAEIEEGTQFLRSHRSEIRALRDATLDHLARWGSQMKPNVLRRCRHIVTENRRVLAAVAAFRNCDLTRFGELMAEAHASFRNDFEASCPEVDMLVELAVKQPGCYGARLTGGGFGGCTVNLVAADHVPAFVKVVRTAYLAATKINAELYISRASAGARSI